jgi:outer membrane immunogenic protein
MVYGTVGAAAAGTQVLVSNPAFGTLVDHQVRNGWVAGGGAEWAAWSAPWGADLTFKVEYLRTDFGSAQYFNPSVTVGNITTVTRETHLSDNIVRAGVNLKFDPSGGTVAAAATTSGK